MIIDDSGIMFLSKPVKDDMAWTFYAIVKIILDYFKI